MAAVASIASLTVASEAAGQTAPTGVTDYRPPVTAPVLDPFRAPASPYGPGNRGIEYDTAPGDRVVASASGSVAFAGAVAGNLHVTIRHADGVRTSYSFLASIDVVVGQRVEQGDVVGSTGDTFHFGARVGNVYIDPAALFGSGPTEVRLVPHDRPMSAPSARVPPSRLPVGPWPVAASVAGAGATGVPAPAAGWFVGAPSRDVVATLGEWQSRRRTCTPAAEPVPAPAAGEAGTRRVAVLVGGLGSSSGRAAITGLDTAALGYDNRDVVRFSYAGGRVPDPEGGRPASHRIGDGADDLGAIEARDYTAVDTLGDLRVAGDRLAHLLHDVAEAAPGAVVDVVAHSQGGVVSRLAIDALAAQPDGDGVLERLGVVATIGSSHQGADVATLVRAIAAVPSGAEALEALQALAGTGIEPDALAVAQLAEGSQLLRELATRPPPAGVDVWSISARGDVVVAAPRTRLPGATNVVVSVAGLVSDHERLPAAPAVTRELALALAGRRPTCEGMIEALVDALSGAAISWVESGLGLIPGVGAMG